MRNYTLELGKHRIYRCGCGARCHRPLRAADTRARPFPLPCERCERDISDLEFTVVDSTLAMREFNGEAGG